MSARNGHEPKTGKTISRQTTARLQLLVERGLISVEQHQLASNDGTFRSELLRVANGCPSDNELKVVGYNQKWGLSGKTYRAKPPEPKEKRMPLPPLASLLPKTKFGAEILLAGTSRATIPVSRPC